MCNFNLISYCKGIVLFQSNCVILLLLSEINCVNVNVNVIFKYSVSNFFCIKCSILRWLARQVFCKFHKLFKICLEFRCIKSLIFLTFHRPHSDICLQNLVRQNSRTPEDEINNYISFHFSNQFSN